MKNDDVAEMLALLSKDPPLLAFHEPGPDPEPARGGEPAILYTGWRLEREMLYVTKTNKQGTQEWEEKLALEEFEKLAEAACQLADADEEITASKLSEKAQPGSGDKLYWQAHFTLAVLYFADIASYVGGHFPVRWRVQQGLTAEKILAAVKEMREAGKHLDG